jgi:acyl-CoA thioester hydrolase
MHTETAPFRVRYADTDAEGVAYYGSYFTWQEVGECHFLETHGFPVPDMDRRGFALTVAESYLHYLRPVRYDELIHVRTRLAAAAAKRFLLENEVVRTEDGEVLAVGRLADVYLSPTGDVQPLPERLVALADERVDRVVITDRVARHLVPPPPGAAQCTHEIRVRYAETDAQGVAYCGRYFAWFEEGRGELTRRYGLPYSVLERTGVVLPVAEAYCRYHEPLRPYDRFLLTTTAASLGKARMTFTNRMTSLDGRLLAEGFTVHACTHRDGRPHALPPEIVERLGPRP